MLQMYFRMAGEAHDPIMIWLQIDCSFNLNIIVDNNKLMDSAQARIHLHRTIIFTITVQLSLLLPTLMHLIFHYLMKEPYHTSILSGYAWLQELLHGHSEHIRTELGVHKDVFHALIRELWSMGHNDTRYMTLEEQLAIYLDTSVTGLSICHVGERF